MSDDANQPHRVLYCRCAFAQTVPQVVKDEVLQRLSDSSQPFEAVSDLCEMSAQNDPRLQEIAACGRAKIVACYPRAVRWLFHAAAAPLPEPAEALRWFLLPSEVAPTQLADSA